MTTDNTQDSPPSPQVPPQPNLDGVTVAEARKLLMAKMDGRRCPCCTQTVKLYRRPLTHAMARSLIEIYRYFREHPEIEWVHVQNYLASVKSHGARGGDVTKLRFWNLLRRYEGRRDDTSNRVGLYAITDVGREFVRGNTAVPRFVYIFNNTQYLPNRDEEQYVTIRQALGAKHNFEELMGDAIVDVAKDPSGEPVAAAPEPRPHKPIGLHLGGRRAPR